MTNPFVHHQQTPTLAERLAYLDRRIDHLNLLLNAAPQRRILLQRMRTEPLETGDGTGR